MDESNAKDSPELTPEFTPERYQKLIHAALSSKEEDFFQEYLGQKSPGLSDYLMPQGRFAQARDIRAALTQHVLGRVSDLTPVPGDATVGQARSMFPEMPLPPGARTQGTTPAPTSLVPNLQQRNGQPDWDIDSLQHNPANYPAQIARTSPYNAQAMAPSFYASPGEEVTQVPTEMINDNMLLPKTSQSYLAGQIHQKSLRPFAPNQSMKPELLQMYNAIRRGEADEAYPGQADEMASMLNINSKGVAAGSDQARLLKGKADTATAQGDQANELVQSQLDSRDASTKLNESKKKELDTLLDPRRRLIEAQINKAAKDAMLSGNSASLELARERLMKFHLYKNLSAKGELGIQEEVDFLDSILQGTNLEAVPEEKGMLREALGFPAPGVKIQPVTPIPRGQTGSAQAPPPANKQARAKALYDRMKEGDEQTLDGVRYRKTGKQLVPVQ